MVSEICAGRYDAPSYAVALALVTHERNKGVGSLFLATQSQLIKTPDPFYPSRVQRRLVHLVYLVYLVCLVGRIGRHTRRTKETRQTEQTGLLIPFASSRFQKCRCRGILRSAVWRVVRATVCQTWVSGG